eukprot:s1688_g3.t3
MVPLPIRRRLLRWSRPSLFPLPMERRLLTAPRGVPTLGSAFTLCRTTRAIMSISRAPSLTRLPALRRQESGRTQCPFRLSQMRPEPRSVCGRLTLSSNDASPPRCCGWSWRLGILGGLGRSALTDALMPVSPRKFKSSISMGLGLLYRAGLLRAMSRPTAVDCLASSVGGTR